MSSPARSARSAFPAAGSPSCCDRRMDRGSSAAPGLCWRTPPDLAGSTYAVPDLRKPSGGATGSSKPVPCARAARRDHQPGRPAAPLRESLGRADRVQLPREVTAGHARPHCGGEALEDLEHIRDDQGASPPAGWNSRSGRGSTNPFESSGWKPTGNRSRRCCRRSSRRSCSLGKCSRGAAGSARKKRGPGPSVNASSS